MRVGAVITAAGMSSRMGDFKPMMSIGKISIAQRTIATLRQAGAEKIVVVTGCNAEELERHLAPSGVIFLRNENFSSTQMFDSACIGFEYMRDKCDPVLFTPVDIPLFTARTVERLLESGRELACPVYEGEPGHPILMSGAVIERVLCDSGEGGLQGALSRCGFEEHFVQVNDPGILMDADTQTDYRALLELHNSQLVRPVSNAELAKERVFFDRRVAMLLSLVDETQSVRLACRRMQLSYSSGWNTIKLVEEQLGRAVVSRSQGGAGGGKSELTQVGKELLGRYERFVRELTAEADRLFGEIFDDFFQS